MSATQNKASRAHPVEVVVAAISAMLLVALIVYLTYRGFQGEGGIAELTATVERVDQRPAGYIAQIRVDNAGEKTAATVTIEGTAGGQTGQIEFDYVPAGSTRHGSMHFREDPVNLELNIMGYSEP
ncbi:hypothetical protein [Limoniibacter endophyticus]|uniref:TIGR02588 family protein n=1 Tax=Limoniibacter endophyticus TaxID=1565040 RepID=A0A8J3GIM8_9HYPH|nr:hypothetical protein [Limoniibacter endophyticus]GHC73119.1 hypothetical protein GCM10010136_21300 [Limoniibacter endophyticus]